MNQKEYMDKLNTALSGFDKEIRDEIINDYEEHFRMGALNGKTEEEISSELGSIDELVEELKTLSAGSSGSRVNVEENTSSSDKEETGAGAEQGGSTEESGSAEKSGSTERQHHSYDYYASGFAKTLGMVGAEFCKKSEELMKGIKDKAESFDGSRFTDGISEEAEKFADVMNQGADKLSETAERFARQVAESFEQTMGDHKPFEDLKSAPYSQAGSETCEFEDDDPDNEDNIADDDEVADENEQDPEDGNTFDAEDEDSEDRGESFKSAGSERVNRVIIESDCADIKLRPSRDGHCSFEYNNYGSRNQQLAYRFYHRQEGDTIYAGVEKVRTLTSYFSAIGGSNIELEADIPADLHMLMVKTVSGDIDGDGLSLDKAKLESVSGDIDLSDSAAADLMLQVGSGDLSVSNNSCRELTVHSASGDVNIFSGKTESGRIYTASGDIEINATDLTGLLIDTASGDIRVSGCTRKLSARSASGDVELSLNKNTEAAVSAVSGDIDLSVGGIGGYTANIKTVSGDICLQYEDETRTGLKNGVYCLGSGEARFTISTISGDIEVNAEQ